MADKLDIPSDDSNSAAKEYNKGTEDAGIILKRVAEAERNHNMNILQSANHGHTSQPTLPMQMNNSRQGQGPVSGPVGQIQTQTQGQVPRQVLGGTNNPAGAYYNQYNSQSLNANNSAYFISQTYGSSQVGFNNYLNPRIQPQSYTSIDQQVSIQSRPPMMQQQTQYQNQNNSSHQIQNQSHLPPSQPQVIQQAQPAAEGQINFMFKVGRPKTKLEEYSRKFNTKKLKDLHARPYSCTFPGCEWAFARQSDLRRHNKSHAEPMFRCPYWRNDPTCHRNGGAFNRLDVLKRHLRLVHYVQDKQNAISGSKEDPGWCRACQRMFQTSKAFIDHCLECAQQSTPAEWKSADNLRYQQLVDAPPEAESIEFHTDQQQIYEIPKPNTEEKENFFLGANGQEESTTSNVESQHTKRRNSEVEESADKKLRKL